MVMELHLFKHVYIIADIDISKVQHRSGKLCALLLMDDLHIRLPGGNRIIIAVKSYCICRPALKVKLRHLVCHTVMHVDRTLVKLPECLALIHLRDLFAAVFVQKLIPPVLDIPHGKIASREFPSGPCKLSIIACQFFCSKQHRNCLPKVRKQCNIVQRQRNLCCCRPDMCQLNDQVILINHRIFTAALKKPAWL